MATRNGQQGGAPQEGFEGQDGGMPEPAFPNMGEPEEGQEGGEGGGGDTLEARLAAMEERLENERQQFAEERKQWQSSVDRLIQGQAAPQQPQQPAQQPSQPRQEDLPGVDLSGLPDPVDKPQEYQAELGRRISAAMHQQAQTMQQRMQQTQQQTQQELDRDRQLNELWDKFKTEYSDLADKQITLNGAVTAEFNDMRRRGVDPMQGIFANPDGFMQSVATRMRNELGQPANGDGNQPPPQPNRTKGLGGGSKPSGAGEGGGKNPPGFLSQLKKAQLDSGLI